MEPSTQTGRKAVHFGGGNIGRGFMAPIFHNDGYEIVFVDVVDDLVNRLNESSIYTVRELGSDGTAVNTSSITNFRAINSKKNPEAVVEEIKTADIVTCAVGPTVLKFIASNIADGIRARDPQSRPLAIIACENMVRATDRLQGFVEEKLGEEASSILTPRVKFSNSAVDRIVPTDQEPDSLNVKVEVFFEWCIEEGPFGQSDRPVLSLAHYVGNLDYYIQRKLFTVNTAHAVTAYFAHNRGIEFIHDAIRDEKIVDRVRAALRESSELLVSKYGSEKEQREYVAAVVQRFHNPALRDTSGRVGRGPLRKMGLEDRLVGPANGQAQSGRSYKALLEGMEMALRFQNVAGDDESTKMAQIIASNKSEEAARKILEDQLKDGVSLEVGKNINADLFRAIVDAVGKVQSDGKAGRPQAMLSEE